MKNSTNKKTNPKESRNVPCDHCSAAGRVKNVLLSALLVGLIVGVALMAYLSFKKPHQTTIEVAKLAVIDDVLRDYIERYEVVDGGSYQQMTGYGISDEDNVFYVTFDYIRYDDERHTVRHGIMYFWPSEDGGYSRAFSYHDDNYHPGGEYVKTSDGIDQETVNLAPEGWWPSAKE